LALFLAQKTRNAGSADYVIVCQPLQRGPPSIADCRMPIGESTSSPDKMRVSAISVGWLTIANRQFKIRTRITCFAFHAQFVMIDNTNGE